MTGMRPDRDQKVAAPQFIMSGLGSPKFALQPPDAHGRERSSSDGLEQPLLQGTRMASETDMVSKLKRVFSDSLINKLEQLSPDDLLFCSPGPAAVLSRQNSPSVLEDSAAAPTLPHSASTNTVDMVDCSDLKREQQGEEHVRAGVIALERVLLQSDDATLARGQTNFEGICNLLNSNLGAALLTMPQLFEIFGIWLALGALTVSAVLNYLGVNLIFAACYHKQVGGLNYTALGLHSLGNYFRIWVVCILTVSTFCNMTNYLLATYEALKVWLVTLGGLDLNSLTLMLLSVCMYLPFTLVRSMKNIAIFSAIAAVAAVVMVILSLLLVQTTGILPGRENVPLHWAPGPVGIVGLLAVAPRCVLTFSNQSSACIVAAQMRDSSRGNLKFVTMVSLLVVYCISVTLGVSVYWMIRQEVASDFLQSLPLTPLTQAIHLATLVLVGVSYIFNVAPCRIFAIELLFKKNENVFEASQAEFLFVTLLLNGLAMSAALHAAHNGGVGLVAGLAGAICSSSLAFIFPPVIAIAVRSQEQHFGKRDRLGRGNLKYYLLIALGVVILATGVYANLASGF